MTKLLAVEAREMALILDAAATLLDGRTSRARDYRKIARLLRRCAQRIEAPHA